MFINIGDMVGKYDDHLPGFLSGVDNFEFLENLKNKN